MEISTVEIYITGSPSINNQKLFAYLRKNINRINAAKMRIDFIVAKQEDAEKYKNRGIIGFPTLISKGQQITGNSEVEAFFNSVINRPSVSDDEMLSDYMKQNLSMPPSKSRHSSNTTNQHHYASNDTDDDDSDNESKKLQNQIQQALRDRVSRDPAFGKGMNQPPPTQSDQNQTQIKSGPSKPGQKKQRASNVQDVSIGNRAKAGLAPANDDDLIRNLLANQAE